ncbi:heme-dependent oxidative N-demethylase family protein [Brevibacterium litoralis]|uniref:heme-dependent oxidative N-demethylase family protein n=1 Tax=Brevibacterium litoralis TaxID=3138935 RepID=UPI0032EBD560
MSTVSATAPTATDAPTPAVGPAAATPTGAPVTDLTTFPFPFRDEIYRYSANLEPGGKEVPTAAGAWGREVIVVDAHYEAELAERARILDRDPTRHASSPHMRTAEWDALTHVLGRLAADRPETFRLTRSGHDFHWENDLTGQQLDFTWGDDRSVPGGPLKFLSSQVQEDVALLDQREGSLWLDAGVVTFAADWSMGFDTGMRFQEIHGPVPRVHAERIIARAEQFMMRLEPGEAYRRTNWTLTVDRKLDTSTETYPEWGPDRTAVLDMTGEEAARRVHLRVEVQHIVRLPHSGAVMFLIRSYLEPIHRLAQVPEWRESMARVIAELPEDMADYKGIIGYRHVLTDWL